MTDRGSVLVIDDEPNILKTLTMGLRAIGFTVDGYRNPLDALEHLTDKRFDLAFVDLMMKPIDGMQVLKEIRQRSSNTSVVIITAHGSIESAVEAIKNGALDFLQKPFDLAELQLFTEKVLNHHQLKQEVSSLRQQISATLLPPIITRNPLMKQQIELAQQVADSMLTVLIEGESGTGKELIAKFIHQQSGRREKPFIIINCSALPETLLESELFGHVKGAFTGAIKDRAGRFEAADGGTVFLDEIGELPQTVQVKLLRFLQDREFERVGENLPRKVDVRIIAATNRKLADALKEGIFREDLYYRLNAVRISPLSLRDRPEDVLLLLYHFLKKISPKSEIEISNEALKVLTAYRWPGNVREVENVIERATLLAKNGRIDLPHLPPELLRVDETRRGLMSLEEMERQYISRVLGVANDLEEAARILEIDPATLWRKRKKYGI